MTDRNLARGAAREGSTVACARTATETRALIEEIGHEGDFVAGGPPEDFRGTLERPRRLMATAKAGDLVEAVIQGHPFEIPQPGPASPASVDRTARPCC